jgi:hypothetical protein
MLRLLHLLQNHVVQTIHCALMKQGLRECYFEGTSRSRCSDVEVRMLGLEGIGTGYRLMEQIASYQGFGARCIC